jgi:hypothetical protein
MNSNEHPKDEVADFTETLVFNYQTTRRHIQKYRNLTIHDHEYLKSHQAAAICFKILSFYLSLGRRQTLTKKKSY